MFRRTLCIVALLTTIAGFAMPPIRADAPGDDDFTLEDGTVFIIDFEETFLRLATSDGSIVGTPASAQFVVSIEDGGAEVISGIVYADSVETPLGPTGEVTFLAEDVGSGWSIDKVTEVSLDVEFPMSLTYTLIDDLFGVTEIDDYTESFTEPTEARFAFSADLADDGCAFEGIGRFEFVTTGFLAGALLEGGFTGTQAQYEPKPTANQNPREICLAIQTNQPCQGPNGKKAPAFSDQQINQMIDETKAILAQCNVKARIKLSPDDDCIPIHLVCQAAKGGGLCAGIGKGHHAQVVVGKNSKNDCGTKGVATTFGRVLAHEVGHAMGLPQSPKPARDGNLMSNCAPGKKLDPDQCELIKKRNVGKKLSTPQQAASGAAKRGASCTIAPGRTFKVTNTSTEIDFDDLHIDFSSTAWVEKSGNFKDSRDARNKVDFGRGKVNKRSSTTVKVTTISGAKVKEAYWTLNGKKGPDAKIEELPKDGGEGQR